MSILFLASLPRSSSLGFSEILYRGIDLGVRPVILTGHLHLAAELSFVDVSSYHSPLHLYTAREALIRGLMTLHEMHVTIDNYQSIIKYYFDPANNSLISSRFKSVIDLYSPLLIDPSFSHSIDPSLLMNLPDLPFKSQLLILWRNPISFSLDLMQGVYAFDSCLQWILSNPKLKFPLDPLMLWLEFVKSYLEIIRKPPSALYRIIHVPREMVSSDTASSLCSRLSIKYRPKLRPSILDKSVTLLSDCPYSGDPSYLIRHSTNQDMQISSVELARFSSQESVVNDVMQYAEIIGYQIVP